MTWGSGWLHTHSESRLHAGWQMAHLNMADLVVDFERTGIDT